MRHVDSASLRHRWPVAAILLATLCAGACGQVGSDPQAERREIEAALEAYLPKLAEAYATRNATVLEGYAVPKEIAVLDNLLDELAAEGRVVKPELKQLTVEDFTVWNYSNAFVTTVETWDLRVYTLGAEELLSETLGQRNRVKYQMKREGDTWVVLLRQLNQTLE